MRNFRKNKRGYISFIIFISLFVISLFAELIANEKPLLLKYDNSYYFPIFKKYSEQEFGGVFATEADYKDEYVRSLILKNGYMIMPLIKYHHSTINYNLTIPPPTAPSLENLFGTDGQGRDIFARILYGIRISFLFGISITIICTVLGVIFASIQGYFGGIVDLLGQRLIEIWSSLPTLFILIILSSFIIPNFWWILIIFSLFGWMGIVSPVRAEFLRARSADYVKVARVMGVSNIKIMFRHILPNALITVFSFLPFMLSSSIVMLASLDFLGFGLPPGSASLGDILLQARENPEAIWIGIVGFITITLILSILVFIGEAMRDVFKVK